MFGQWRPRAVAFDCDGLLVDTESCWTVAETELFAARGLRFATADKASLIGVSVPAACALLARRFADGSTAESVERELTARVVTIVARDARAMDGAAAVLEMVLDRMPAAVASNAPRALLDQALRAGAFARLPAVTVAADEVPAPKPAPDLYLTACERMGVAPGDCLALEDSAPGIAAATAAGLRTVGVPTLAGSDIGAEWTVPSLTDPALVTWLAATGRPVGGTLT